MSALPPDDPYFIDFPQRVEDIQDAMANRGIEVYLGSRLRTLLFGAGMVDAETAVT